MLSKNVDMIIVACGTVSSNCLDILKKENTIPIYSILEPTVKYLNNSKYKNILVIATHATINSHIFKNNVKKNIYELETPKLVPVIEHCEYQDLDDILHDYLDKYNGKIDALILGCTHYPIIKDRIKKVLDVDILDMSEFVTIENSNNSNLEIYFSKIDEIIINNTCKILNNKNIDIKQK